MTYTEAHTQIDNLLDKTGTGYFNESEKNRFLDLAVLEYTKGLINVLESDSESMIKIAPLTVKSSEITPIATSNNLENSYSLPDNFYHLLRAYTASSNYNINIMSHNEYASAKNNPFHRPDTENPIAFFRGAALSTKLIVVGNNENVFVEYIKQPHMTNGDSTVATSTGINVGGYGVNSSEEIVNIAVRKMMLSLEDPRYQLQNNELTADKR
tara:strand:- start:730 stop:1365 length:636 start_codon:yes stop_codon:yes gene_type:complete